MSDSAPADPRDRLTFYFHATPLRRFVVWFLANLFRLFMKLDVHGLENIPASGPAIVACNHVTNFDVFPMQLSFSRTVFYMGKAELFRFSPLGAVLRNLGAFPVYRGEKDAWAIRHARRVLEHGQLLGMFPEGHRSKGRGLGLAKTGTARLAIEANCPIVPMIVVGTDRFFKAFPHRARIRVEFLPPILPNQQETAEGLTERMMLRMAAALPAEMRGVYSSASSKVAPAHNDLFTSVREPTADA